MADGADIADLAARLTQGDPRALSRGISWVEDEPALARELLARVYETVGRAQRIGITGPPGAGKSTLTAALVKRFRAQGRKVGVVAVDPTSPYTGGAVLGDRIRMAAVVEDPEVFIRSMATRGRRGGLAAATADAVDLMEAAGKDLVLVETVGVGQTDVDVGATAHTTVLVVSPESGDAIQAMKAGIMEVADVFVVNKADRPDAAGMVADLRAALEQVPGGPARSWAPPVLTAVAVRGEGLDELLDAVAQHREQLLASGGIDAKREAQLAGRIREHLVRGLAERFLAGRADAIAGAAAGVAAGSQSPFRAAQDLLDAILGDAP